MASLKILVLLARFFPDVFYSCISPPVVIANTYFIDTSTMASLVYALCLSFLAISHGDLDDRIRDATHTIDQYPDSTELYLVRGELYLLHEESLPARADFYACLRNGLENSRVFLGLSKALISFDLPDSSLYYVNCALDAEPENPSALEWKGFVLQRMGRYCESGVTYTHLISLTSRASPSLFLNASNAWINCAEPQAEQKAVRVLLQGMSQLGPLHILEKELVHVYLHYHRLNEALLVQTDIIDHWPVKITPYIGRAQTYVLLGDITAARKDLASALETLDSFPPHRSHTRALQEMRRAIVSALQQLDP